MSLQIFVENTKSQVVNGCISLGSLLKSFQSSYPSISLSDRTFLLKNCMRETSKVDFVLF